MGPMAARVFKTIGTAVPCRLFESPRPCGSSGVSGGVAPRPLRCQEEELCVTSRRRTARMLRSALRRPDCGIVRNFNRLVVQGVLMGARGVGRNVHGQYS